MVVTMRELAYEAIDSERMYQDKKWGGHSLNNELATFLLYIDEHVSRTKEACVGNVNIEPTLHGIRKVAALCVAAMEAHGALPRVDQEGS